MRALWLAVPFVCACGAGALPLSFVEPVEAAARPSEPRSSQTHFAPAPEAAPRPLVALPHPALTPPCAFTKATLAPAAASLWLTNTITVEVAVDRGCRAGTISIELVSPRGSPFEVRTKRLDGARQAAFTFPVAGSAIEQRGLSGTWQVRTFVDGRHAGSTGFELSR